MYCSLTHFNDLYLYFVLFFFFFLVRKIKWSRIFFYFFKKEIGKISNGILKRAGYCLKKKISHLFILFFFFFFSQTCSKGNRVPLFYWDWCPDKTCMRLNLTEPYPHDTIWKTVDAWVRYERPRYHLKATSKPYSQVSCHFHWVRNPSWRLSSSPPPVIPVTVRILVLSKFLVDFWRKGGISPI